MTLRRIYSTWISPQRWLELIGVRAPMQIAIGLALLTLCVLIFAQNLKLLPSQIDHALRERAILTEIASSQAASAVSRQNYAELQDILNAMVMRYDDVLSACLRKRDGSIVAQTRDHERHWAAALPHVSTLTHIHIEMTEGQKLWGRLEIAFKDPHQSRTSLAAWWSTPTAQLMSFLICALFLLFWLYLSRMLTMLHPSAVIPDRMQLLMDTLVEGIAILDNQGQMVMTNEAFAQTAFISIPGLIGRKLSSLPWLADKGEAAPEVYPWEAGGRNKLQQRGVPMRLQIGARHTRRLNVNASPIQSPDGKVRGTIVTFDDQTTLEEDNIQLSHFISKFSNAGIHIRQLRKDLQRHASDDQLEKLDDLARAANELTQLCQYGTENPTFSATETPARVTPQIVSSEDSKT